MNDYKEIALSRHKRANTQMDGQWLWQYDQDPHKAKPNKNPAWHRKRDHELPPQAVELLHLIAAGRGREILFKGGNPNFRAGPTPKSLWEIQIGLNRLSGVRWVGREVGWIWEELGDDKNTLCKIIKE